MGWDGMRCDVMVCCVVLCSANAPKVVEYLLDHKLCEVNETDGRSKRTALAVAAAANRPAIVEALLRRGADPTLLDAGSTCTRFPLSPVCWVD
jgi:hypothetical protein